MDNQAQLSWEARFGRLAAASAFIAIAFQIASFVVQLPALSDAPGRNDALRYRETLLNFKDHSGVLLGSAITQGLGAFFAAGALFYLFRATRHRRAELPQLVQWVIPLAPVLITVAVIANWSGLKDASDRYTTPGATANVKGKLDSDQRKDIADYCRKHARGTRAVEACRAARTVDVRSLVEANVG